MTEYRYNPAWMATTALRSTSSDHTPGDLAVLLLVLGEIGARVLQPHEVDTIRQVASLPAERGPAIEIAHSTARDVGGFHTVGHAIKGAHRLAGLTNGGAPLFGEVHVGDRTTAYILAGGPASIPALPMFGKELGPVAGRRPGRHYVSLDPASAGRFKSSFSLPTLGRALAWIKAGATEGLPDPSAYRIDREERTVSFSLAPAEVGEVFGFALARTRPAYVLPALDRVVADLRRIGISMRVTPRKAGNTIVMLGIVLREIVAVDVDMSREDPHDVRYDGLPTTAFKRPPAPEPDPDPVDPPAPEDGGFDDAEFADAYEDAISVPAVEPVVDAPTPETTNVVALRPRSRMTGIVIADEQDDVEPTPVAVEPTEPLTEDDGENELQPMPAPVMPPLPFTPLDDRPPWLLRRFVHLFPGLPDPLWCDRPVSTPAEQADALRAGVHVWVRGMGARPERLEGYDPLHGAAAIRGVIDWSYVRWQWVGFCEFQAPEEWVPSEDEYAPPLDDDPESHLPAARRRRPRDPANEATRPHDGLGYVDEEGNPIHANGTQCDRSRAERRWADRVPVPVFITA